MDQLFLRDRYSTSNYLFMEENQPNNKTSDDQKLRVKQLHKKNNENLAKLFERLRSNKRNGEQCGYIVCLPFTTKQFD